MYAELTANSQRRAPQPVEKHLLLLAIGLNWLGRQMGDTASLNVRGLSSLSSMMSLLDSRGGRPYLAFGMTSTTRMRTVKSSGWLTLCSPTTT